jgi:(R,R)-butanediol dehydrogenase / meso-butanediol dehydrogenase / diacetyl reductase
MRVLVWDGPRQSHVAQVPDPRPGPDEVIVRTGAAGICGSEIEGYLGRQANRTPPLVMGHELAGEVIALGEGADRSWAGRTVAVNPVISCRTCRFCLSGARNLCRRKGLIGIARPGGFAEMVAVPAANLIGLPDGTDPRLGAFVEPMANGVHAARLAIDGNDSAGAAGIAGVTAAVIGAGAIGLCCAQALRLSGAGPVDVVEPDERRRGVAARSGVTRTHRSPDSLRDALGIGDQPRLDEDSGADVVIDAVGTAQTRQLAVDAVRPHGRVVLIGMHEDESPLAFRPVVRDEVTLVGSYAYTDQDFSQAARWVAAGDAGPGELEPVHPLTQCPALLALIASGTAGPVRAFLGRA